MINNNYLTGVAKLVLGQDVDIPSHMAYGSDSGTLTADDLEVSGEFDRIELSTGERDENIAKFIGLRTGAVADNETMSIVGILTSSAGGDLWVNTLLSSFIHTTDFDFEVQFWMRHRSEQ